jgi:hypothetical protein
MAIVRTCALLTIAVLAAYHAFRILAVQCSGPRCDNYTAAVLLLPLALLLTAATGLLAIASASRQGHRSWLGALGGCTLLGVLGPPLSLVFLRASPDTFVAFATALVLLVPVSALSYSASAAYSAARRT